MTSDEYAGMREPIVPQLGEADFLAWDSTQHEKFELHHGFVVAMPSGTIRHEQIAFNVRAALENLVIAPCRAFGSSLKIRVASDMYLYADAGVVCEGFEDRATVIERPTIVVEVLSPSTRAYDIIEKRAAYRSLPSLRAYVIVHTEMACVEVDSRRGDGWQTHVFDDGEVLLPGCALALTTIYARTSVLES